MADETKPLEIETRQKNLFWPVVFDTREGKIRVQYYQETIYPQGLKTRRIDGFKVRPFTQKQGSLEKECFGVCSFWEDFYDCVPSYAEGQKTGAYAGGYDPNFHIDYIATDITQDQLLKNLITELNAKRSKEIDYNRKECGLVGEVK
jgi:hypothetical protein